MSLRTAAAHFCGGFATVSAFVLAGLFAFVFFHSLLVAFLAALVAAFAIAYLAHALIRDLGEEDESERVTWM